MSASAEIHRKNWNGKPYHSLDYMLRETFGEKVYKVTLNGGMSCPNRDGKLGSRGCIFCSAGGSGDFAADAALSVTEQIDSQIELLSAKRPIHKYIAYFQAYTNTYAPVEYLHKIFTEAIRHPSVVALSIGTRPDCLGESVQDILETMKYLNARDIQGIKLQLLHVLKGTDLAEDYLAGKFRVYEREEYLQLLIECLEHLDPSIVIHRMTGDGPEKLLIAPVWASRKREVLNILHHEMKIRNSWQGKQLNESVEGLTCV